MIYTVTFNPSLDYIVDVHNFRLGMTNRTVGEQLVPGGKGTFPKQKDIKKQPVFTCLQTKEYCY